MPQNHSFQLFVDVGKDAYYATIKRSDGKKVTVTASRVPTLFLELAADDDGNSGNRAHHLTVLESWFDRSFSVKS